MTTSYEKAYRLSVASILCLVMATILFLVATNLHEKQKVSEIIESVVAYTAGALIIVGVYLKMLSESFQK